MGAGAKGPEHLIGQTIAGYTLVRSLGTGATGAVFLGKRVEDASALIERSGEVAVERPDEAAIKLLILPWQLTPEERAEFQSRFLLEAETLKRLRHPNILSVLAYGQDAATELTYMVLPYMSGGTLAGRMSGRGIPMPLAEVSNYLSQIAPALDYAHGHGVVHRDVKPANILLDDRGVLFLADFSIVRLLAETVTRLTSTGRVMGTPAYMAPEQVTGGQLGPATDIYSLGMVVYEMVTGQTAFQAATLMDLIRQQALSDPPSPRQFRPDLPKPAAAAILQALAKDPANRFKSTQAFAEAFALGLQGQWAPQLVAETPIVPRITASAYAPTSVATTPSSPPWGVYVPVPLAARPSRRRGGCSTVLAVAIALFMASALALAASNPSVMSGIFGGNNTPATGNVALATTSPTRSSAHPTSQQHNGSSPTATTSHIIPGQPTATSVSSVATATDTPVSYSLATPTDTPPTNPTNTPVPSPTPTATPCPYLNGGNGVTFYDQQNYSGNSWTMWVAPGQTGTVINLPGPIAGHLNSFRDGNEAWHVVLYQGQNGTGNLGHFDNSQPVITSYWQATQSVKVYVNRSC